MASLTRGTSFRRQGSSGSTWTYNEEGVLVRSKREQSQILFPGSGSLSKVHIWNEAQTLAPAKPSLSSTAAHLAGPGESAMAKLHPPSPPPGCSLERSKSVGNAPSGTFPHQPSSQRSRSKIMKWLKKTIYKLRN